MYLLEYFKQNDMSYTLKFQNFDDLSDCIDTLLSDLENDYIISFNVEVIHGNVSKD